MSRHQSYVVVIPVKNESDHLEKTLKSLTQQTVPPSRCVIVDDGSVDNTPQIAQLFAQQRHWIEVVQRPHRSQPRRGGAVIEAFYTGFGELRDHDWDYLVKLDGDLSFASFYFEELLNRFASEPTLGIAGGALYVFRNGTWAEDRYPNNRTWGAVKMYRRACFEAIGGLLPHMGWDAIDDFSAQMHGWQTRTFRDLVVLHYRPVGKRSGGFSAGVEHGRGNYHVGSHPVFVLIRGIYRMWIDRPLFVAGAGLIYGYFTEALRRTPRAADEDLVKYVQKYELARLFLGLGK